MSFSWAPIISASYSSRWRARSISWDSIADGENPIRRSRRTRPVDWKPSARVSWGNACPVRRPS